MDQEDFRRVEYKMLRDGIVYNVAHRRRLEELCILAIGLFYAFTFTHVASLGQDLFRVSLLVPGLVVFLGVFRWLGILSTLSNHSNRMVEIEEQIGHDRYGWEHYMQDLRSRRPWKGAAEILSEAFTWALLGFFCLATCLYLWNRYDALIGHVKAAGVATGSP